MIFFISTPRKGDRREIVRWALPMFLPMFLPDRLADAVLSIMRLLVSRVLLGLYSVLAVSRYCLVARVRHTSTDLIN